ncbi:MAG: hypothetical protein ORN54_13545 [Cyclobacteriaceae bacterium]|nr:hypothetical protein [Cyclobacteriaceae bacterium]
MKHLDDIPKKQPFTVPDGYFEDLPMRIQAKIQKTERRSFWIPEFNLALKFALPVVLVGIISVIVWINLPKTEDALVNLDAVPTEQLLAYLEADEISTEEIIENVSFTNEDVNSLYQQLGEFTSNELDELAQQYDFNF